MSTISRAAAAGCAAAIVVPLAAALPSAAEPLERERIAYTDSFEIECDGMMFPTTSPAR